MSGPWVHNIDPIITTIGGVHVWWYGLSYSLGFLNAHLFLRRNRDRLGLSLAGVYELSWLIAAGVLIGGRSLVVFRHEWTFYRDHLALVPAVWLGGLATHGLIIGGLTAVLVFCVVRRTPFRPIFDALAIPAAVILGCGRIGNFIDGQIVGSVTDVPWAVQFPDADGFRHPVVLYDGLKNFLIVPILILVQRHGVPPGRVASVFLLLYAGLRIPIDMLREYPISFLWLPAGQTFNVLLAVAGLALLVKNWRWPTVAVVGAELSASARGGSGELRRTRRSAMREGGARPPGVDSREIWLKPGPTGVPARRLYAFAALAALALVIPSDATRDIPARYGHRHAGLTHSLMYPAIGIEPQQAEANADPGARNKGATEDPDARR